jgi:hypothetical protein
LLLGLLAAPLVSRSIIIPLPQSVAFAQRIAEGDRRRDLPLQRKDELGQLMTAMQNRTFSLRKPAPACTAKNWALERTQPMLPMGFGDVEGVTHDYKRHGTIALFAALNVPSGKVMAKLEGLCSRISGTGH